MSLHHVLPLVAFGLNLALAALALFRNAGSRLHRVFTYFVLAMALWNLGVFMLRRAADPSAAYFWEVAIHVGVIAMPAFYYHFVLIFLDSTVRRRSWLVTAYVLSVLFSAINLSGASVFMEGVLATPWGWAPAAGPLYNVFFAYFYFFLVAGLLHLAAAYRRAGSGFRRNRIKLVLVGATLTIAGGFVDIIRFTLAPLVPELDRVYPVGIPANMICAVMFGTAIVRYRMFDLSVVVKKFTVYGAVGAAVTAVLIALTWLVEQAFGLHGVSAVWIVAPLGLILTLVRTPLGRPLEDWIERLAFDKPRGCHDTLVDLSKRMSMILEVNRLVDTLIRGLLRGIPVTHCALLVSDDKADGFVVCRQETTSGETARVRTIPRSGRIVRWLERTEGVLVKEEAILDRRIAQYFEPAMSELEEVNASLIVPMKLENRVTGILLLGEKLSGAIFDGQELELLSVLANQAAIAMGNARLYEEAERERRRIQVLYELARRLATASETDRILDLIVEETSRLLGVEVAGLRLVEEGELVLKAWTGSSGGFPVRPRLRIGESLTGRVVATNAPLVVDDVLAEPGYDPDHRRAAEAAGLHSFLGVPIAGSDGTAAGVLYVYTRRRPFSADEVSLLGAFADQTSVLLEKSRMAAERKQAEEALRQGEKLATMGQLLAGVAHELNNPLTAIVGYATLLSSTLPDGSAKSAAGHIETSALRCGRIVRNFLALARKRPPERKRVALNQAVTESVELLAYPLRVDDVKITQDLAGDLPDLWADPHQLQQVVVNLLTNAHHAVRQVATRRLSVLTRFDAGRGRAVLRVADTGPGVPPEIRARLFEPFFTTKPVGQGTGLGLSLCLGIVESHGGSIALESLPGYGAVFRVELPVERPLAMEAGGAETPTPAAVPARTILVVDDEAPVCNLLTDVLALDGHRVRAAPDARTALRMLDDGLYDLIVSDIRMPGLDGPALYREVEQRRPSSRPTFVFMTGDVLGAETLKFLEQTRARCLSKPFSMDDVRGAIQQALSEAPVLS